MDRVSDPMQTVVISPPKVNAVSFVSIQKQ